MYTMNQHSVDIFSGPVPKVTNFPRYNTKFSGENKINTCFVLYLGNSFYFLDRGQCWETRAHFH